MMTEQYIILIVILLFSTIQSIFGVGLLLFGTPTFLLLGYSYSETLWLLLPCSVTISLLQVISEYNLVNAKKRVFYLVIPTSVLGLAFVIIYANNINITRIVGVFLLLIGVVRLSSKLQALLGLMVKKHIQMYYIMIGIVHGVSNMGGGPLSILMSTIYSKKEFIRANVAFVYLILAIFQLAILSVLSNISLGSEAMLLILIALASYFFTNKFISPKVNDKKYVFIFNIIVLTYGVLAIIK
jgi:uncharacterized protein